MNIGSYFSFLNPLSTDTMSASSRMGRTAIKESGNGEESSGFETALLSMIDQFAPAYDKIAGLGEAGEEESLVSAAGKDAKELYEMLTCELQSFKNLNSNTIYPRSIEESLFSMLNEEQEPDRSSNPADEMLSGLFGSIVVKDASSK